MFICLHHTDPDGFASAAIFRKMHQNQAVKFFGVNFGMELPFNKINKEDFVLMVDFAPNTVEEFKKLISISGPFVWIDHHKTSIEKHEQFSYLPGIRRDGTSACELTWEYFFRDEEPPEAIQLIGDQDVWKFEYGDRTKNFCAGLRLEDVYPQNTNLWNDLLNPLTDLTPYINAGELSLKITNINWERSIKGIGWEAELDCYKCAACNVQGNSMAFKSLKEEFDILIVYGHNGQGFRVTLYSPGKVDVSEIAKKYGGGGHAGASGFFCKELPFKFKEKLSRSYFNK